MLSLLKLYFFSRKFTPWRHFLSVMFMSCNFDGPPFSRPAFSVNPLRVRLLAVHCWISTWMAVRLWAGKPVTTGQLSLPSLPRVGKSSTGLAGVKAGYFHLCRVADNTVIPYCKWHSVAVRWSCIKALSTLETIADFGDSRRFRQQSPNSATVVARVDRA